MRGGHLHSGKMHKKCTSHYFRKNEPDTTSSLPLPERKKNGVKIISGFCHIPTFNQKSLVLFSFCKKKIVVKESVNKKPRASEVLWRKESSSTKKVKAAKKNCKESLS